MFIHVLFSSVHVHPSVVQFSTCTSMCCTVQYRSIYVYPCVVQWGEEVSLEADPELSRKLSLDVFREDALIMHSGIALPLVAKYALKNPLLYDNQGEI